jgi:hypothetical protein
MSVTIKVTATGPLVGPARKKADDLQPMLIVAGRALSNLLKSHYRTRDQKDANKKGGARSHFWRGVADSVGNAERKSAKAVKVAIAHPAILQKLKGGIIRAKRAKALTIPMTAEAYGRSAKQFERDTGKKLFIFAGGKLSAFLATKNNQGGIDVHYMLTKQVNQAADPKTLPSAADMQRTIREAADEVLKDMLGG